MATTPMSTSLSIASSASPSLPRSSPALPRSLAPLPRPLLRRRLTISLSKPPSADIGDKLSKSIEQAQEVCAAETAPGECAAAWDEVEELSSTIADKRKGAANQSQDPLEKYCKDEPQADECRVYED